jgi:two-component system, OmpR family, phosphate regulon response regulator OmpR
MAARKKNLSVDTLGEDVAEENLRLLLVDPDAKLRTWLSTELEKRGIQVTAASSVPEVRDCLLRYPFHVAIIDDMAPDMDGLSLLRAIKDANDQIEVLVLTGHHSRSLAEKLLHEGAHEFLIKPQNIDVLAGRIHLAWTSRQRKTPPHPKKPLL